jgi:hypothetical protein
MEIKVTCTETGFQKIGGMYPVVDPTKKLMDKAMVDDVKENKDLLQKFIKPRGTADIEKALEATGEEAPAAAEDLLDEEETTPAPKPAAKPVAKPVAKAAPAKKPAEEPADESDIDAEIDALLS